MLLWENDKRQHGVMWPDVKWSYCYHLKVGYFPITAYPKVFYSSYDISVT